MKKISKKELSKQMFKEEKIEYFDKSLKPYKKNHKNSKKT